MRLIHTKTSATLATLKASVRPVVAVALTASAALFALPAYSQTAGAQASGAQASGAQASRAQTTRTPTTGAQAVHAQQKSDTARKPAPRGALGSQAGDRHLAYKGTGSDLDALWPPPMPAQLPGAILPSKRVIAYYGNPLSRRMGILGEFDSDVMLAKLDAEVAEWNKLDPSHPVQPALHLIAVVAQADAGRDGKYRLRMDSSLIEKVYGWAKSRNAIMFVDVQVGHSTLQSELPWLERFLKRPEVHLGIDPEFSMKDGKSAPGKRIGTYDAQDINYAIEFLSNVVTKYQLPPKMLVVHRFTGKGVTNYKSIKLDPRVQFVMHMDGFGAPWLKRDSYYAYIKKEPVQFAGWKQFTKPKNDKPTTPREEILRLWPVPLYIQIQ